MFTPLCGDLFRLQVNTDNGTGVEWTNVALVEDLSEAHSANPTEVKVKEKAYPVIVDGCSVPEYSVQFTALFSTDAAVDGVEATINDSDAEFDASSMVSGVFFMTDALINGATLDYRIVDGSSNAVEFKAYITSFSRKSDGALKYEVSLKAVESVALNASAV